MAGVVSRGAEATLCSGGEGSLGGLRCPASHEGLPRGAGSLGGDAALGGVRSLGGVALLAGGTAVLTGGRAVLTGGGVGGGAAFGCSGGGAAFCCSGGGARS